MSRLVLLVLAIGLLKNEVKCGTFGKISKTEESLMPRAWRALPRNTSQLNLELSSRSEDLVNASGINGRAENGVSQRRGKFFPKFGFLAGLNIGGLASSGLASLAKVSDAASSGISPYFAAVFDPYPQVPSPYALQLQSLVSLSHYLDHIKLQLDSVNAMRNNSIHPIHQSPNSEDIDAELIDDRKRRKDKIKMAQRAEEKRRKAEKEREKLESLEDDDEDNDTEEDSNHRQQQLPDKKKAVFNQDAPGRQTSDMDNSTNSTNGTDSGNGTYPYYSGYYGGSPQPIGNVGFTYDFPNNAYGPPADSYGLPANSYGPPVQTYGPPYNSYGAPPFSSNVPSTFFNGPSFYPYGGAPYSAVHDPEPVVYEDPHGNSFTSPERWPQYSSFARSRKFVPTTPSPPAANSNGFVPM